MLKNDYVYPFEKTKSEDVILELKEKIWEKANENSNFIASELPFCKVIITWAEPQECKYIQNVS